MSSRISSISILLGAGAAIGAGIWLALWLSSEQQLPAAAAAPVQALDLRAPAPSAEQRWFSAVPQQANTARAAPRQDAVFGRNGRAIDLGGNNVAGYIAARIGAARAGDVKAAYDVYQAASICAANDDPVTDFHDAADRAGFLRKRKHTVTLCAGMSAAQVQERLGFLGTAARAGHLGAQVDFYMEGPYGRQIDIDQNSDDPTVKQWKADALTHLERAGNQCDHFSLALLSTVYDAGQLAPRNIEKSMAYSIAADVPRKKGQTEEQLRARFGDELNAEQFASARQLGAQLALVACPPKAR